MLKLILFFTMMSYVLFLICNDCTPSSGLMFYSSQLWKPALQLCTNYFFFACPCIAMCKNCLYLKIPSLTSIIVSHCPSATFISCRDGLTTAQWRWLDKPDLNVNWVGGGRVSYTIHFGSKKTSQIRLGTVCGATLATPHMLWTPEVIPSLPHQHTAGPPPPWGCL